MPGRKMITPRTALSAVSQKSTIFNPDISNQRRGKCLIGGLSDTKTDQFLRYADDTKTRVEYPAQNSSGTDDSVSFLTTDKCCPLDRPCKKYQQISKFIVLNKLRHTRRRLFVTPCSFASWTMVKICVATSISCG